jgi:hypothetical protein
VFTVLLSMKARYARTTSSSSMTPAGPYIAIQSARGHWNDDKGRTLTEVIEALTDAADDWDRTHHTGGAR